MSVVVKNVASYFIVFFELFQLLLRLVELGVHNFELFVDERQYFFGTFLFLFYVVGEEVLADCVYNFRCFFRVATGVFYLNCVCVRIENRNSKICKLCLECVFLIVVDTCC